MLSRRSLTAAVLALAVAAALAACGPEVVDVPLDECASGRRWVGGAEGDSVMNPGDDCIACHARGDGPGFAAAGTAYAEAHQANDCFGRGGLSVTLTGANGVQISTHTNEAGNFWFGQGELDALVLPYTAEVSDGVASARMTTPQMDTACNRCHTAVGAGGAPGRIHVEGI